MPLPNGPLLLQGYSRTGDTQHSRPNEAMLVRMSQETLDALENLGKQAKVEFQFGEHPGFYIGDKFYPTRKSETEVVPHELYLRLSQPNKPNPPLKLHANITSKFIVERQLDEKVQGKVRASTKEAELKRTQRGVLRMATPMTKEMKTLPTNPAAKKSKSTKKGIVADTYRSVSNMASVQNVRAAAPKVASLLERDPTIRSRMIRYIAVDSRTTDDVMRVIGGPGCDQASRRELNALLEEIAERTEPPAGSGEKRPRWVPKYKTWREARPFEWRLSIPEQDYIIEKATRSFISNYVDDDDPVWKHFRREATETNIKREEEPVTASSSAIGADTKRPTASASEPKLKKPRASESTSRKASEAITAKDERVMRSDIGKGKEKQFEEPVATSTPTTRVPTRRLPGSGYRRQPGSHTPTPPIPDSLSPSTSSQLSKKPAPPTDNSREVRSTKIEPVSSSSLLRQAPPTAVSAERVPSNSSTSSAVARLPKKPKDPQGFIASRGTESVAATRDQERSISSTSSTVGFKRKKIRDDQESEMSERDGPSLSSTMAKRRKLEDRPSGVTNSRNRDTEKPKERDLSLPKKPQVRNASPMPPPPPPTKRREDPAMAATRSPLMNTRSSLPPSRPSAPSPIPRSLSPVKRSSRSPPPGRRSSITGTRSPLPSRPITTQKPSGAERTASSASQRDKERERDRERPRDRDRDRERERDRASERDTKGGDRGRDRERKMEKTSNTTSSRNGSAKLRRRSPIYTDSSEDEQDSIASTRAGRVASTAVTSTNTRARVREPESDREHRRERDRERNRDREEQPLRSTARSNGTQLGTKKTATTLKNSSVRQSHPVNGLTGGKNRVELPDDEEGLRALYKSKYKPYLDLYNKHWTQRSYIEKLLARNAKASRKRDDSVDSDIDMDDGDVEILDHDQLVELKRELDSAYGEMKVIIDAWEKLKGQTKSSEEA
ncbi:hypothetical protein C8Q75DRAFT_808247 [Abortiporus biennis]|nr:hypothetical protein C8Q75DRAFT_808247 [Abortiporus biennis]